MSNESCELIILVSLPSAEVLRELSDSRWVVYDVLPTFFEHSDVSVELGKDLVIH